MQEGKTVGGGKKKSSLTLYFCKKFSTASDPTAPEILSWSSSMMFSMRDIQLISSVMACRDASFSICNWKKKRKKKVGITHMSRTVSRAANL